MPLTSNQRERAWKYWINHRGPNDPSVRFTKPELRAIMDATVTWIEANRTSFNNSLAGTAAAGSGATVDEKARFLVAGVHAIYDIEE